MSEPRSTAARQGAATRLRAGPGQDTGLPALVSELWQLVLAYLKQETVGPIRHLGRFVAMGLAGSVVLSVGLVLLGLGGLRVLQTELGTTFEGTWSWAPYLIVLVVCSAVAALAARAIGSHKRRAAGKGTMAG